MKIRRDVACRLIRGKNRAYLLFWKKSSNEYLALEDEWAIAVAGVLEGQSIDEALAVLRETFPTVPQDTLRKDLTSLLDELSSARIITQE